MLFGVADRSVAQSWEVVENSDFGEMATVESSEFELAVSCSLANSRVVWLMLRGNKTFRHGRIDVEWNGETADRYHFGAESRALMATANVGQKRINDGDAYEPRLPLFIENLRQKRTVVITVTTMAGPLEEVVSLDGAAAAIEKLPCPSE